MINGTEYSLSSIDRNLPVSEIKKKVDAHTTDSEYLPRQKVLTFQDSTLSPEAKLSELTAEQSVVLKEKVA